VFKARDGLLKIPQNAVDVSKLPVCRCLSLRVVQLMSNNKSLFEAYKGLLQVS
jgi:hypothetical protein